MVRQSAAVHPDGTWMLTEARCARPSSSSDREREASDRAACNNKTGEMRLMQSKQDDFQRQPLLDKGMVLLSVIHGAFSEEARMR